MKASEFAEKVLKIKLLPYQKEFLDKDGLLVCRQRCNGKKLLVERLNQLKLELNRYE